MNTDFWLARWSKHEIGFHQPRFNEYLTRYWPTLGIERGALVFVPLCGKTLDMRWLREHAGQRVLGNEIARNACTEFFNEWGVAPAQSKQGPFESFEAGGINILCGDFFALRSNDLVEVRAVFDRAALIALPADMRIAYADKLQATLPQRTPILLIAPDYSQHEMAGPPFAVGEAEIRTLFENRSVTCIAEADVTGAPDNARFRQRGLSHIVERVFCIR
jgi:thiopurine S-methyltransferase